MQESDSDREEFNHFLTQSVSQLRFIDVVFRKQLLSSTEPSPEAPEFVSARVLPVHVFVLLFSILT